MTYVSIQSAYFNLIASAGPKIAQCVIGLTNSVGNVAAAAPGATSAKCTLSSENYDITGTFTLDMYLHVL